MLRAFLILLVLPFVTAAGCFDAPTPPSKPTTLELKPPLFELTYGATALLKEQQLARGTTGPEWVRLSVESAPGSKDRLYRMNVNSQGLTKNDYPFYSNSVLCLVSNDQVEELRGTTIDAVERDGVRGFLIMNPRHPSTPVWLAVAETTAVTSPRSEPAQDPDAEPAP